MSVAPTIPLETIETHAFGYRARTRRLPITPEAVAGYSSVKSGTATALPFCSFNVAFFTVTPALCAFENTLRAPCQYEWEIRVSGSAKCQNGLKRYSPSPLSVRDTIPCCIKQHPTRERSMLTVVAGNLRPTIVWA